MTQVDEDDDLKKDTFSVANQSVDRTNIIMIISTHPTGPMLRPVDHHLVWVAEVVLAVVVVVIRQ
jgi:hypothetical protein